MVLNENWSINTEDANNCTLTFQEGRVRTKTDGTTENYTFKDEWYYPTILHCLKKYVEITQKETDDIKQCIAVTEQTFKNLEKICAK
jgi:hypothetical protein